MKAITIVDGGLQLPIVARYTLDNVEEAHAMIEGRKQIGKAVLRPSTLASRPVS